MKPGRLIWLAAICGGALAGVAQAEDIFVSAEAVEIREGKGSVFPVVATATKGAKLTVLAREGKWLKVEAGAAQGYIHENVVTAQKPKGDNLLTGMGKALGGGAQASDVQTGAAAKGLEKTTEQYADGKNLDKEPLNKLIEFNRKLDPKEWQAFTAEGKVGPDAP